MEDPRCNIRNQIDYSLPELMFLVISAVVSGMNTWDEISEFGDHKLDWLRKFFPFKNGSPWPSTLSRLFARLDSEAFGRYFTEWVSQLSELTGGKVVAIDGKTMRGSCDPAENKAPLHMVSAFVSHQNLCLGQLATEEKSNEITAIPALLDMITLKGCTVTIDAMGCQKEIAGKILEQEADYILQVKGNQKNLLRQIEKVFTTTKPDSGHVWNDLGHGRLERRECEVITDLTFLDDCQHWPGLKSIVRINSERQIKKSGKKETSARFYISSKAVKAEIFNRDIREHWGIENNLHWSLDVNFKEDSSKKRKGHSAANFGLFTKIALTLLEKHKVNKSKKRKRLNALLNDQLREKLLGISTH